MDHRHEGCGAVDHGGVDHLALAGAGRLEQGGHHAEGQQHAAAAEVAHEVQRRHGGRIGPAQRPQRAADGDVVDVVAGPAAPSARPGPTPSCARRPAGGCARSRRRARRPAARPRRGGSPRSTRRPRSTSPSTSSTASGFFRSIPTEGRDRLSRSQYGPEPEALHLLAPLHRTRGGALEPQDLRAGVGQHHARVGRRADARQLNDLDPAQRSTAVGHRRIVTRAARGGQAHLRPAPSWGRACRPRPWTSDHHRRPHRLQRRALAADGHRAGHRGRPSRPSRAASSFGIDSDQFPGQPFEIMLGDTAPVRAEAALAAGLLRTQPPAERRGRPGHEHDPGRCRPLLERRLLGRVAARPRPRPRPPGAGPRLPGGRAQRGLARRPARSPGHRRRHCRPRAPHRLRARSRPVRWPCPTRRLS